MVAAWRGNLPDAGIGGRRFTGSEAFNEKSTIQAGFFSAGVWPVCGASMKIVGMMTAPSITADIYQVQITPVMMVLLERPPKIPEALSNSIFNPLPPGRFCPCRKVVESWCVVAAAEKLVKRFMNEPHRDRRGSASAIEGHHQEIVHAVGSSFRQAGFCRNKSRMGRFSGSAK